MAMRWWTSAITSDSVETWVSKQNGRVSAFCLLITNEESWAAEESGREYRVILIALRLLALAKGRLGAIRRKRLGGDTPASDHAGEHHNHTCKRGKRTWIGLIAVSPHMRGQGLAKKLLEVCMDRTVQLGHEAIKLRVGRENRPARRLYESAGFVCTSDIRSQCTYTWVCESQDTSQDMRIRGTS